MPESPWCHWVYYVLKTVFSSFSMVQVSQVIRVNEIIDLCGAVPVNELAQGPLFYCLIGPILAK